MKIQSDQHRNGSPEKNVSLSMTILAPRSNSSAHPTGEPKKEGITVVSELDNLERLCKEGWIKLPLSISQLCEMLLKKFKVCFMDKKDMYIQDNVCYQ